MVLLLLEHHPDGLHAADKFGRTPATLCTTLRPVDRHRAAPARPRIAAARATAPLIRGMARAGHATQARTSASALPAAGCRRPTVHAETLKALLGSAARHASVPATRT